MDNQSKLNAAKLGLEAHRFETRLASCWKQRTHGKLRSSSGQDFCTKE